MHAAGFWIALLAIAAGVLFLWGGCRPPRPPALQWGGSAPPPPPSKKSAFGLQGPQAPPQPGSRAYRAQGPIPYGI